MTDLPPQKFPWLLYWLLLVAIIIFAWWPLLTVTIAEWLADSHGCALDEGSVHPCMIGGSDWGGTLYGLQVMGWFLLITVPVGLGAGGVWIVALIVHRLRWGKTNPRLSS